MRVDAPATDRYRPTASLAPMMLTLKMWLKAVGLVGALVGGAARPAAAATPATPSGSHPRLFINSTNLPALSAAATTSGSNSARMVSACQETMTDANYYNTRGGSDGSLWPGAAVACAFAYLTTQNATYLTQALKYWNASLNDDQKIGDGLGCVQGVSTSWQSYQQGSGKAPPVILTVTHDTGYPMRWYAPFIALTYDWLYSAPGVDSNLLAQTRTCLTAWSDWYTADGYHNTEAGANYNAGYVVGKTLTAIAIGTDGGADGHLWTQTLNDVFTNLLVGDGLSGTSGTVGMPAGAMVGGDWAEGWQYGPLSVLEYAAATRAVEEQGVPQPQMDDWTNSLAVRTVYGTVPTNDAQYAGGDFDDTVPYPPPSLNEMQAVLIGPSSDQAAAWAASMIQTQKPGRDPSIYGVLADLRTVTPQDYRTQTPAPSLWYLARGTRNMYVRTSWDASAFWGVFSSAPQVVSDHQHYAASNFVFTRGADHLIVDPSPYGLVGTLTTNAVTADSAQVGGDNAPSQTSWSKAELLWARGTQSGVFGARSDFSKAFNGNNNKTSDIPYAHREWVMLPEGEIVTIDRVQTGSSSKYMYVNFHANTKGTLKASGSSATGTVGGSQVAIHSIYLSGGTPAITQPSVGDCSSASTWGACTDVRFPVDNYGMKVPGPYAVAIHAIDGLGASEAAATVGSLNDDNYDPAPKQNAGVIGAAVYRASKQSYVVASSAQQGASGSTMTYGVPGTSPSRHVVYDAPEDSSGKSMVTAAASGGRCVLTITAGAGMAGEPLMFTVASAADGCTVSEDTAVAVGTVPPGGGVSGTGGSSSSGTGGGPSTGATGGSTGAMAAKGGGCACTVSGRKDATLAWISLPLGLFAFSRRRPGDRPAPRRSNRRAGSGGAGSRP